MNNFGQLFGLSKLNWTQWRECFRECPVMKGYTGTSSRYATYDEKDTIMRGYWQSETYIHRKIILCLMGYGKTV